MNLSADTTLDLPFYRQQRWQLTAVFMVTLFVGFMDRINITFALPLMAEEYGWTEAQLQSYGSALMGLFYGAYGLANIFLTPFAARLGTRRSLLLIVVLCFGHDELVASNGDACWWWLVALALGAIQAPSQ